MVRILSISLALTFAITTSVFARVVYVSSYKTTLFNQAGPGGKVMSLRKGSRLKVLSARGVWLKVSFMNKTGWVKKFTTSSSLPGKKFSILGSARSNARIHARRRASSDVTAASARGLMQEKDEYKGRTRASDSGSGSFDMETITKIESQYIPEDELIKFLSDGGINQ